MADLAPGEDELFKAVADESPELRRRLASFAGIPAEARRHARLIRCQTWTWHSTGCTPHDALRECPISTTRALPSAFDLPANGALLVTGDSRLLKLDPPPSRDAVA